MRNKIMFVGESGSGKTYQAVRIVERVGGEVLYVDTEDGAGIELEKAGVDVERLVSGDFFEVKEAIERFEGRLLVIDSWRLVDMARAKARELFLEKGEVMSGDVKTKIKIEDPTTFDLAGWMYQVPNRWLKELMYRIVMGKKCDIVITGIEGLKGTGVGGSKGIEDVYAWMDIILRLLKGDTGYSATVVKWRGARKIPPVIRGEKIEELIGRRFGNGE